MQMLVCIRTADCIRMHTGNTHPEDDVWAEPESLLQNGSVCSCSVVQYNAGTDMIQVIMNKGKN